MKTWTLKVETMTGLKRTLKFVAETMDEAVTLACQEQKIGNILEVWQGKSRWM